MNINFDKLRAPQSIFIMYVLVSGILIVGFRFFFPGSQPPLPIYSGGWGLMQGLLEFFNLFPALALSALVIPFGLASFEENYQSFSEVFFKRLVVSVVTAIAAAAIYALIFFLAFPLLKGNEENMRSKGELYRLSKTQAQERADSGEWPEALRFLNICDSVWPNSPELASLRTEVSINMEGIYSSESDERSLARAALTRDWRSAEVSTLSGGPVDATQAIEMSRAAFNETRYFDAHWLATLGTRLAERGSPEAATSARLASDAWNRISSLAPNQREVRLYQLHNLKLSGYQAMNSGDFIRAYYIFQELLSMTPDDPDAANFFAASERGTSEYAFFTDEMDLFPGEILTGALFSLPGSRGRTVLRFSSLTISSDVAYGTGLEYMEFDENSRLTAYVSSRYAKVTPFTLNEDQQVLVLMHALDRFDKDNFYDGEWLLGSKTPGGIILNVKFEDLLLLSHVRHGVANLQIDELFTASRTLSSLGYVPEIFQAEILNRLGSALFFLPMAIFMIIVGWRYRTRVKPRYLFILMLPILPVVFNGFVYLYRSLFNTLGIWLVLSVGFTTALILYIVTLVIFLFISLISLAAQHS